MVTALLLDRTSVSPSPGTTSSRTAAEADSTPPDVFAGFRSETSSEIKLSLVTLGMWGLTHGSDEEFAGASTNESGQGNVTLLMAPSPGGCSRSNSASLTPDGARTSPEKKQPALWKGQRFKTAEIKS